MFGNESPVFAFRGPFGIRVEIAGSFFLLAFLIVGLRVTSAEQMIWSLGLFAVLAASIFLHELGHAWGCRVQDVPVRRIVLHGAGGFCERATTASNRQQELIVAMGPIVNLFLWAVISLVVEALWFRAQSWDSYPGEEVMRVSWLLSTAANLNLFLALFNLIPVQPLDGGKLFQLALIRVLDPQRATRIAGIVGLAVCVVWIPAMMVLYLSIGWILFFIPSFRLHLGMARLRGAGGLRRRN